MSAAPTTAERPNPPAALRLRGVGRRFGGLNAVRDLDLEVAYGERRTILGPNGAGKTTLFNVIAGDLSPTSGTVELFGEDVTERASDARALRGVARSYQQSRLFHGLTVEENIALSVIGARRGQLRPLRLRQRDAEIRRVAADAAARTAIHHKLSAPVNALSHGEHRQVALAMALAVQPRLVLLDEPAAGLSKGERRLLTDLLLQLDTSITLLLIEHDMDIALQVADRVTMLHDGRVIAEGTPDEIRSSQLVHDLYLGRSHTRG